MDFNDLASRLGIDEGDFRELVALFVSTSLGDIEKIRKGMADQNPAAAAAASHSIKGAAGNLGFEEIYTLAKEMEMTAKQGDLGRFAIYLTRLEGMVDTLNRMVTG